MQIFLISQVHNLQIWCSKNRRPTFCLTTFLLTCDCKTYGSAVRFMNVFLFLFHNQDFIRLQANDIQAVISTKYRTE